MKLLQVVKAPSKCREEEKAYFYIRTRVQITLLMLSDLSELINPLSANITKLSNTLKQFVGKLPTNCLSVFDHFVGLALKGLTSIPLDQQEIYGFLVISRQ